LTGTRRRWSVIRLPERLAETLGESEIIIEHFDEGISPTEIPYISAFWELKEKETSR